MLSPNATCRLMLGEPAGIVVLFVCGGGSGNKRRDLELRRDIILSCFRFVQIRNSQTWPRPFSTGIFIVCFPGKPLLFEQIKDINDAKIRPCDIIGLGRVGDGVVVRQEDPLFCNSLELDDSVSHSPG